MIRWRLCWWSCGWVCSWLCQWCYCRGIQHSECSIPNPRMQMRGRCNSLCCRYKIHVSLGNIKRSIILRFCGKNVSVKLLWSGFFVLGRTKYPHPSYPPAGFVTGDYSQSIYTIQRSNPLHAVPPSDFVLNPLARIYCGLSSFPVEAVQAGKEAHNMNFHKINILMSINQSLIPGQYLLHTKVAHLPQTIDFQWFHYLHWNC